MHVFGNTVRIAGDNSRSPYPSFKLKIQIIKMADDFGYDFSDQEEDYISDHTISDIDDSDESDDGMSR